MTSEVETAGEVLAEARAAGELISTVEDVDVVIVGAGIAGLAAAREISGEGLSVAVVEARNRVGGRLLSLPTSTGALDLGATWFWPHEPRVCALIAELDIATHSQFLAGAALYQDLGGVHRLDDNPVDVTSGRVTAGLQELASAMSRELPKDAIRLGHEVTRVGLAANRIVAETAHGRVQGRHLILAIPPALAWSAIEFVPGLDEETDAVARHTPVWMGAITKVVAQFSSPFWRDRGLAGAAISHVGPIREIHDMSGPNGQPAALFGFVPPTVVGQPTVTPAEVLGQLVQLFGPEAARPSRLEIHDWRNEAHTSPCGVEQLQAYELFGHPCYAKPALDGRLHWASTETSAVHPGHIEGALDAAHRAAKAVVRAIRA